MDCATQKISQIAELFKSNEEMVFCGHEVCLSRAESARTRPTKTVYCLLTEDYKWSFGSHKQSSLSTGHIGQKCFIYNKKAVALFDVLYLIFKLWIRHLQVNLVQAPSATFLKLNLKIGQPSIFPCTVLLGMRKNICKVVEMDISGIGHCRAINIDYLITINLDEFLPFFIRVTLFVSNISWTYSDIQQVHGYRQTALMNCQGP